MDIIPSPNCEKVNLASSYVVKGMTHFFMNNSLTSDHAGAEHAAGSVVGLAYLYGMAVY
jgi:hypothetical protein